MPSILLDHLPGHHGCQAPVFLSGPPSSFDARERLGVFREALHRHGIADSPNQIFQGDFLFSGGVDAVKYFWDHQAAKPDLVARLGEDEFTLLAGHAEPSARELLAERLDQQVEEFNRSRTGWQLSYSLGGVYSPPGDETLLGELYQQKQVKGRGR